jgi:hypothetical protein
MTQYASLYAVGRENGATIVLPEITKTARFGIRLFDLLDIPHEYAPNEFFKDFNSFEIDWSKQVDERVYNLGEGSYFIDGRFDLFKYWHPKYESDMFSWKIHEHLIRSGSEYITEVRSKYDVENIVSVHVRLGDYLLPQHNHFVKLWNTTYYQESLEQFDSEKTLFLFFTNDVNWCSANLMGDSDTPFVNTGNDCLDFTIMSMCDSNVIANSSYSWWAAFLNKNPNKRVICPKNYLMDYSQFRHINGNYYPTEWFAIENQNG